MMSIHLTHLRRDDYVVSQWSGGSTTQIAIAPAGAQYADRDFLWRISSATVDLPTSNFTPLPDYYRHIALLYGEMALTHNQGAEQVLVSDEVHPFDGGDETDCRGRCVDFNLMTRKGQCEGEMFPLSTADYVLHHGDTLVIYCVDGTLTVCADGQSIALTAGDSVLCVGEGALTAHRAQGGRAICAKITS